MSRLRVRLLWMLKVGVGSAPNYKVIVVQVREKLGLELSNTFKLRAEKVAFVEGEDTVVFAHVARAIEVMRSAGIEKVGLITAKLEATQ